jgi:hypothetical protein
MYNIFNMLKLKFDVKIKIKYNLMLQIISSYRNNNI